MTTTPADTGGWDIHTHLVPDGVIKAAGEGAYGMAIAPGKLKVCGHGVPLHSISNPSLLIERLESDRLDGAIVSVPPPLFRPDLGDQDREAYTYFVNNSLIDACRIYSDKLRPLAYLPAEAPLLAASIARKLDNSWAGIVIGTELVEHAYSEEVYDQLWGVLAERGWPIFIHPGSSPDPRLKAFYLGNLLGNPMETSLAAAHIIFGGVLHRHPNLKFILAHGGGCAAAMAGRWQHGVETDRPGVPKLDLMPLEALRRFYVDSLVHAPAYLDMLIEMMGVERILLGSDWPFPMGSGSVDQNIGHLPAATRHHIRTLNAKAVFGAYLRPN